MTALLPLAIAWLFGLALWPFVEHLVHGVLSHRLASPIARMHGSHHRDPRRVFTPPKAWLSAALLLWGALTGLLGPALGSALLSGLLTGFTRYERVHYRIHFRPARSARERLRQLHHLAHHHRNPNAYFGVSQRLTDRLFGSLPATFREDYAAVGGSPVSGSSAATRREPSAAP